MTSSEDHFFVLNIDQFNGPIDLLLHLVKQNELEIERLSLSKVCSQYLACIEKAEALDLDVAGEYLVMASTLLAIKSSHMLEETVELVPDEDGNMIDPHDEILRRLKEAQVYKEGATQLSELKQLNLDVFQTRSTLKFVRDGEFKYADHDAMLLGKAFTKLIKNLSDREPTYNITLESVSIVDTMVSVVNTLKKSSGPIEFSKLLANTESRGVLISSFIALLELCKRQIIHVEQEETYKDIMISLSVADDVDVHSFTSEFEPLENVAGIS